MQIRSVEKTLTDGSRVTDVMLRDNDGNTITMHCVSNIAAQRLFDGLLNVIERNTNDTVTAWRGDRCSNTLILDGVPVRV